MQGYYSRRTTLHLQKYPSKNTSTALLITENRPHVQSHSESAQSEKLRYKLHKSTSFEIDQAHYLHKIFQRIEYSNDLRPLGHTGYRGKQSAHQDENHDEEKHDEHRLLYRIGIIRDNQPEPRNNQYIYGRKQKYRQQATCGIYPVHQSCQNHTQSQYDKPDDPIGYEFRQYKHGFFYRCYIDLFYRSGLFFPRRYSKPEEIR